MNLDIARRAKTALAYLGRRQLPDGCITDDGDNRILGVWDSVHSLRAFALWREELSPSLREALERLRAFLKSKETPEGLMSWGDREPEQYSAETSSEYITALLHLGLSDEVKPKLARLRRAQLPSGPCRENHGHIPEVFQTMPSVTAFVLRTFCMMDALPSYPKQA